MVPLNDINEDESQAFLTKLASERSQVTKNCIVFV